MKKTIILLAVIVALCVIALVGCSQPDEERETEIFGLVNQARVAEGLEVLIYDSSLYNIALMHCQEMYQKGEITHNGFDVRVEIVRDYGYMLVGENLGRGFERNSDLVNAWLLSPEHRENIMNPFFFYSGLASYEGYTCQIFGGYDLSPFLMPIFDTLEIMDIMEKSK